MKQTIYCKENKVRFEYKTNDGFVGSFLVSYRAGRNMAIVGKKRVYYQFICHQDGDIEFGQRIKTEFLKTKRYETNEKRNARRH